MHQQNRAIFFKKGKIIDTHRLSFLMHWTEFLPHHSKAYQPELSKGLYKKGFYGIFC